jgi:sugar O-acyltransferase (sialic acid O-acetyltransferase NeuD family)
MPRKHDLYIIGASNFARELESWLQLIPVPERNWELKGFLHYFEGESPLSGFPTEYKIAGDWRTFRFTKDDFCIAAVADCRWKMKIYEHLKDKATFFTYIAPDAVIGKYNRIGEGSVICPGVRITTNVEIGKCVILNIGTQIGHDCVIGDFSSLMPSVDLGGSVKVGKNVFIGTKATLIPKISVGDNATIGAGSVVVRKVKSSVTVFGNPAKVI